MFWGGRPPFGRKMGGPAGEGARAWAWGLDRFERRPPGGAGGAGAGRPAPTEARAHGFRFPQGRRQGARGRVQEGVKSTHFYQPGRVWRDPGHGSMPPVTRAYVSLRPTPQPPPAPARDTGGAVPGVLLGAGSKSGGG
jgi:hypothetical protein